MSKLPSRLPLFPIAMSIWLHHGWYWKMCLNCEMAKKLFGGDVAPSLQLLHQELIPMVLTMIIPIMNVQFLPITHLQPGPLVTSSITRTPSPCTTVFTQWTSVPSFTVHVVGWFKNKAREDKKLQTLGTMARRKKKEEKAKEDSEVTRNDTNKEWWQENSSSYLFLPPHLTKPPLIHHDSISSRMQSSHLHERLLLLQLPWTTLTISVILMISTAYWRLMNAGWMTTVERNMVVTVISLICLIFLVSLVTSLLINLVMFCDTLHIFLQHRHPNSPVRLCAPSVTKAYHAKSAAAIAVVVTFTLAVADFWATHHL